jgi:hypothetical protein
MGKRVVYDSKSKPSTKKCNFCGGENHLCRQCPIEAQMAPILKKYIGKIIENFIASNYDCPCCNKNSLHVLGNHTPSLDIECNNNNCLRKFEVKSKCLSVTNLPADIKLPHGSFEEYSKRQKNGLDLFVVIYKVDRIRKIITIREVLYAKNKDITENKNIKVVRRKNSHLSTIYIKDRNKMIKKELDNLYQFDFSKLISAYLNSNNTNNLLNT